MANGENTLSLSLERLADGEVEPVVPRLGLPVDQQTRNRVQLEAHVGADRTDGGEIADAGTDVVAQVAQVQVPGVVPDVARIGEEDRAQVAPHRRAQLD